MEEQVIEKKVKTEKELMMMRLSDSMNRLRVLHELRWNLNTIFSDIGDTSDYIEANEAISEIERETWEYILKGLPD